MTRSQRKVLLYIQDYVDASGGVPPTYDEICAHLGSLSRSNAHRIIHALCERGYLRVSPRRWRTMKIVRRIKPRYAAFVFDEETKTLRRMWMSR